MDLKRVERRGKVEEDSLDSHFAYIYISSFEYSMAEKSTKHSLLQLQLLEREDGGGGKQSGIRDYVSVAPDTLQPCVAPSPSPGRAVSATAICPFD